jgi:hypothetical protein
MFKENRKSTVNISGDFDPPENIIRTSLYIDYERGGVNLNDPYLGLNKLNWKSNYLNGGIKITDFNGFIQHTPLEIANVTELSFSFDRNMAVAIAYMVAGTSYLYFYDSTLGTYNTLIFNGITSIRLIHDDLREIADPYDDILFFYIKDNKVYFRRQRDRYVDEFEFCDLPEGKTRIQRLGFSNKLRLQVELV